MKLGITGHRPNKLPGGYNINHNYYQELWFHEVNILVDLITNHNIDSVRIGGALGIDQFVFDISVALRETFKDLKIHLSLPCLNMDAVWYQESKDRLKSQISLADSVTYVDELKEYEIRNVSIGIYHISKLQKRNMHIVDNSDIMHGIWNGDKFGGTYNCLKYTQKSNKRIVILHPNSFKVFYIGGNDNE